MDTKETSTFTDSVKIYDRYSGVWVDLKEMSLWRIAINLPMLWVYLGIGALVLFL